MAQKHLHELLQEDQEPFHIKRYIADRRYQLNKNPSKYSLQTVKKQKSISPTTTTSNNSTLLCKHACFFSIRKNSSCGTEILSPINFSLSRQKSPARKNMFLHIPSSTSSLLLEAAMRIQKQQNRPKSKKTQMGFGLFGSILKKIKERSRKSGINHEIGTQNNEIRAELRIGSSSCSCNHSRLSSAGWSESNEEEEKSMDFETSSSCRSENEEIESIVDGNFGSCESRYCTSPLSPFRFSLQKCLSSSSSTGCRTPEFSSPVASPVCYKKEDKENYEGLANIEQEEDEKEQCSPVSVLDPPFDDDGHECEYEDEDEDEDEDEEDDDCGIECNYAIVQRAQQQLLSKLRRFEKLAELDPIELEKLMLEEEGNDDLEYDNDSMLSYKDHDFETFASEVTIPFDMKKLVSDLISEEKIETNNSNNREEEVVFGRVCKRLDSWQHVRSDTIDMMVESDLKIELDDWKNFHEQREETALEVEVSIFRLLVEELAEEIVHFDGHHGNFNKVFA